MSKRGWSFSKGKLGHGASLELSVPGKNQKEPMEKKIDIHIRSRYGVEKIVPNLKFGGSGGKGECAR